ncbi:MAG: hypothetical protein K2M15_07645 [Oscillospiraceae bacterium]|nr:hypothetical protein [Oscillospiraceae bacterium]MDE7170324.1 hypothetical protein [Oscillospiraceae bacterium]
MTEIEKIQRYIDRTGGKFPRGTPYQMTVVELLELKHMTADDVSGAICMAFDYGRAKGYRTAKAEQRAGTAH